MLTLTEFLAARIEEDEAAARRATQGAWKVWGMSVMADPFGYSNVDTALDVARTSHEAGLRTFNADHIARHDPARVLAECEAKRQIVAGFRFEDSDESAVDEWMAQESVRPPAAIENLIVVAKALALPYADHPDYRQEWKS